MIITYAASSATNLVNALSAFYVATRNALTTPPDLNADLLDYYMYTGLQAPINPAGGSPSQQRFDIRTARRIRGEDRTLMFRATNNEVTDMQLGMEFRALLKKS